MDTSAAETRSDGWLTPLTAFHPSDSLFPNMFAPHSERDHFTLSSDLVFFRHLLGFTVGERLKAWGLGAVRCLVSELFHLSGGGVPHPGLPAACQPYKCVCVCVCGRNYSRCGATNLSQQSHCGFLLPPGDKADSSIKPLDLKFRDRLLGPVWIFCLQVCMQA